MFFFERERKEREGCFIISFRLFLIVIATAIATRLPDFYSYSSLSAASASSALLASSASARHRNSSCPPPPSTLLSAPLRALRSLAAAAAASATASAASRSSAPAPASRRRAGQTRPPAGPRPRTRAAPRRRGPVLPRGAAPGRRPPPGRRSSGPPRRREGPRVALDGPCGVEGQEDEVGEGGLGAGDGVDLKEGLGLLLLGRCGGRRCGAAAARCRIALLHRSVFFVFLFFAFLLSIRVSSFGGCGDMRVPHGGRQRCESSSAVSQKRRQKKEEGDRRDCIRKQSASRRK